jgi:hypothetical protein
MAEMDQSDIAAVKTAKAHETASAHMLPGDNDEVQSVLDRLKADIDHSKEKAEAAKEAF